MTSTEPESDTGLQPMRGPATLTDYVYEELKKAIVEGRLRREELYAVATLADQLNVSRTPVREALLQLARDGLVRLERSRGVRIVEPRAHDVQEIFVVRRLLEPWAARQADIQTRSPRTRQALVEELQHPFRDMQAAARHDDEQLFWRSDRAFHLAILTAAGNHRVAKTVDDLRDIILLRDATTSALRARKMIDVAEDHRPILRAIEDGNPGEAHRTMSDHIIHASQRVLQHENELQRTAGGADADEAFLDEGGDEDRA